MLETSLLILIFSAALVAAAPIKHRFVVFDEAGHQLVHVDENNPTADWKTPFDVKRAWDIQRVGNDQLTVSTPEGIQLVDLKTGRLLERVKIDGLSDIWSVRRMADGRSMVIGQTENGGAYLAELNADLKILRKGAVSNVRNMRVGRISREGHALATPDDELVEWDLDGNIVKRFKLFVDKGNAPKLGAFMALKDKDGNYWVACGYGALTVKIGPDGKELQRFSATGLHFHGGFQFLPNGNLLQTNWSGHHAKPADVGTQLVEFNPQGEVVWSYRNPEMLLCPVSVIVLDASDTQHPAADGISALLND